MKKYLFRSHAQTWAIILLLTSCSATDHEFDTVSNLVTTSVTKFAKPITVDDTTTPESQSGLSIELTYNDLLSLALKNNPQQKEAKARFQAATRAVTKEGALPDPHLSLRLMAMPADKLGETKTNRIMLEQMVPWFGKLALKEQLALLRAEQMRLESLEQQNNITQQIKDTWLELGYLKKLLQETIYNLELRRQTEDVILNRYRTDGSSQAELIRIQIKIAEMETELLSLKERAQPLLRQLTALTGGSEIDDISKLRLESPEPETTTAHSEGSIKEQLYNGNINLKITVLKRLVASTMSELAEKDYYPNLTFSAEYMFANDKLSMMSGPEDSFLASVGISLPLNRDKYDSALDAAHFNEEAAEAMLLGKQLSLESAISKLFYKLRDTRRTIELYSSTMQTKAEEALATSIDSFSAGQTSFADLLEAEETLLHVRIALVRAKTDYLKTENSLNALLGKYALSEKTTLNNEETGK
ncbi:MAG: TolC family protein [bacterium]|nr:TolC family protein [bacterium]